jgi:2-polyprenyl-3-methyl-5-hydroxy-6-metoxy-1,4-benzoquinol methylase
MKHILELGCGQGFNAYILSKNKKNKVIGVDLSKDDVKISKKRYPGIKFIVMNAEKLKFKDSQFDSVYALEILEHVNNLDKVVTEIARVLKSNGKLIASIPFFKSEKWLLKIRPSYFKEIHHVRIFKKNELEKLCKKKNLSLYKKEYRGFLQHIELLFLFKRHIKSNSQVSIGSWRDNLFTKSLHAFMLYMEPLALKTPLVYLPIWLITIPLGAIINYFGNMFFPKGIYYEFIKK